MKKPHSRAVDQRDKPEERVAQINPHGVLHLHEILVISWVLLDEHLAEDTEQSDPKDTIQLISYTFP